MRLLTILAHPETGSFTEAVARRVAAGFTGVPGNENEIADLVREGFDPRLDAEDLAAYRGQAPLKAEILREQQRIDGADALLIVAPMYWWGMPAVLKGWFDRVFTNGWAYRISADGKAEGMMRDRPVHLVLVAASDRDGLQRHGVIDAIKTTVEGGTLHWIGLQSARVSYVVESESPDAARRGAGLADAESWGRAMAQALGGSAPVATAAAPREAVLSD